MLEYRLGGRKFTTFEAIYEFINEFDVIWGRKNTNLQGVPIRESKFQYEHHVVHFHVAGFDGTPFRDMHDTLDDHSIGTGASLAWHFYGLGNDNEWEYDIAEDDKGNVVAKNICIAGVFKVSNIFVVDPVLSEEALRVIIFSTLREMNKIGPDWRPYAWR